MSLSLDVGAFIAAVALALLWLVKIVVKDQLNDFKSTLILELDTRYYSSRIADLQQKDLERRLTVLERA